MQFIPTSKFKKTVLIVTSTIAFAAILVILFISPIAKYIIEKYDEKYTGRQIKSEWMYVNPFTGYIYFNKLKIYELNGDSVFFSANSLSLNISIRKLFINNYELSDVTIDHPMGVFIQNKDDFNFSDIITKFSPEKNSVVIKNNDHFSIGHVNIKNGEFYYREPLIPIIYFIKKVNIESDGPRWEADSISAIFSFMAGIGSGEMNGKFMLNLKNNNYNYTVAAHKFDLNIIEQYMKDLSNYGSFAANLDANIKSKGNFKDAENVTMTGTIQVNDFHFGKNAADDYSSFKKLVLVINELSPKKHKYMFDSLLISHPYFKYELYDSLDNLETMFGKSGNKLSNANSIDAKFNLVIEIANYVKILARNFFQSYYQINRFAIYNGDLKFNDYSMSEKFTVDLNPLTVIADSVDKNHKRVNVSFQSAIKPFGNAEISLSINPKDTGDFDMTYKLQKFPAAMFNPYTIAYTSFPVDRGTIEINGIWNVRKGNIQSTNHLVILDPRVTKRIRNKDTKWEPLPLIMSFIRERGNVIDYEIPISGNLKNPNFHLHDVFSDVVKNIFVKPATTGYRMEVKNTESEIENFLTIKWEMAKSQLTSNQQKFLEKIADFLKNNPGESLIVSPQIYSVKEKEYLLLFETKRKYLFETGSLKASMNEDDSEKVIKMSIKDSLFVRYLNKHVNDSLLFTIQEKCSRVIGENIINDRLKKLSKEREEAFLAYFKKLNTETRVKFLASENVIPYNGFSFYKIQYNGKYPESLIKAYKKMNELNNEIPRDKFKKDRKNNKVAMKN